MKLLSPDHILVVLRIEHPVYGTLQVDRFQRSKADLREDLDKKSMKWMSRDIPVVSMSHIPNYYLGRDPIEAMSVVVQWDFKD